MSENVVPAATPKRRGTPFPKGQSGNPGGRTTEQRLLQVEIERIHAGKLALEALNRLRNIGMGKVTFVQAVSTRDGVEIVRGIPASAQAQVAALVAYLDRVGVVPKKPKEDDGAQLGDMTADEMDEMAAELARRAGAKRAEVS